jgi:hypothetical protein
MTLPSCHSGYRSRHRRPNRILVQRREERGICGAGDTAGARKPTSRGAFFWQSQSYQNVSRETFWYDLAAKPYKAQDSGHSLQSCKIDQFFGAIGGEAAAAPRRFNPLPEVIRGVRFAQNRDCHAGCPSRCRLVSSVTSDTQAVNDGIFSHRNYAPFWPRVNSGFISVQFVIILSLTCSQYRGFLPMTVGRRRKPWTRKPPYFH